MHNEPLKPNQRYQSNQTNSIGAKWKRKKKQKERDEEKSYSNHLLRQNFFDFPLHKINGFNICRHQIFQLQTNDGEELKQKTP